LEKYPIKQVLSFLLSQEFSKLDNLLLNGKAKLLFSEELIEEFLDVVKRPKLKKYFAQSDVQKLLDTINEIAEFIDVKSDVSICRDEKDNFLLGLALDGKADVLITGDKDLLVLKKIEHTFIVTMQEYLSGNQSQ